jgi:hypothetical protein
MAIAVGPLFEIGRTFLPRFVLHFFDSSFMICVGLFILYPQKALPPSAAQQGRIRIEVYSESY